ncbi:lytic transglycosylase domain-containing protein [Minwuia sp.]|uniref:lytic transglycosylase domain-containing protein n=1 Tax=Minwuia sp. TaxID=2493630 RepID=UPI003A8E87F6
MFSTLRNLAAALTVLTAMAIPVQAAAADLPDVLSAKDAARYAEIFRLQGRADWRAADRLIRQLDDRLLMGHVLHQRYMHPTGWRASYEELHTWMKAYADHPDSGDVHELATKRRPRSGWKPLTRPRFVRLTYPENLRLPNRSSTRTASGGAPSAADRRIVDIVKSNVRRDRMTVSEKRLAGADGRRMTPAGRAEAHAALARGHLSKGRFERALQQGDLAMREAGGGRRLGAFHAGIALWAMDRQADALTRFRTAAATPPDRIGNIGGAVDYWHARAALAGGHYDEALTALERTTRFPRDIYGLLAAAQLARFGPFVWTPPSLDRATLKTLMTNAGIRRAIALAQAGQIARADMELNRLSRYTDSGGGALLIAVAAAIDAPASAYRMARIRQRSFGEHHDTSLYPVPRWQVDTRDPIGRALLLAVARRESGYNPDARSRMGARGLMQIMPNTAAYVARKTSLKRVTLDRLHDPEVSLKFGQAYLGYLSRLVEPRNCLIHMLAAYNAGPGNLQTWERRFGDRADPLLFIELLGSRETRHFVRDVLSAYWIYRDRMDLPTPSLIDMAEGRWPLYVSPRQAATGTSATATGAPAHAD